MKGGAWMLNAKERATKREMIMYKAMRFGWKFVGVLVLAVAAVLLSISAGATQIQFETPATLAASGASTTLLPTGEVLRTGGVSRGIPSASATITNLQTGSITLLSARMNFARAWHTATLLPDGGVLILGGLGARNAYFGAERLIPTQTSFQTIESPGLINRAFHSATLLTDGRVLIVGGTSADGKMLGSIQLWDSRTGQVSTLPVSLTTPRSRHTATLLPDGTVLIWGGVNAMGTAILDGEIVDATAATVRRQATILDPASDFNPPEYRASIPQNGAADVATDALVALRFSKQLRMTSVTSNSITLSGPEGWVPVNLIPAEGGMLVFVWPSAPLQSGTLYTLSISTGLADIQDQVAPDASFTFTTAGSATSSGHDPSSGSGTDPASPSPTAPTSVADDPELQSAAATQAGSAAALAGSSVPHPTYIRLQATTPVRYEQSRQALARYAPAKVSRPMAFTAVNGTAAGSAAPEVIALANALNNDPDLIYQYVHDNIEFDPLYGELKGPLGTLLDGRGDSFDQSALMVALLNQASLTNTSISNVNFELGALNLTSAQLQSWLGVDGSQSAANSVLGYGGIPGYVNSDGSVSNMGHCWVKVSISGTAYVFDPAFKGHSWKTGVIGNFSSITGYNQSAFLADANASVPASNGIIIQGRTQLRQDLATYARQLASYIKSNLPTGGVSDVIGGGVITPAPFSNGQTVRQTSLSYQGTAPTDSPSVPTGYIATLSVTLPGATAQVFNSPDIYGQRLSIFFDTTYKPTLYLNGASQAVGTAQTKGAQVGITFAATIPWNSSASHSHTQYIAAQSSSSGGGYVVMNGWDQVGRGMIEKHRKLLTQAIASGAASSSELVLGESLTMEGLTWLAECAAQQQLTDQLLGSKVLYYYGIGIVGEAVGTTITSPYVDLPLNLLGTAFRKNTAGAAAGLAAFLDASGIASSFESTTLEQLNASVSGFQASSTIKLLDLAVQQGNTIYDINSTNWSAIQNLIRSNYNANDLTGSNGIGTWVGNGFRVIAPSNGKLAIGGWTGVGFKTISSTSYGEIISGGLSGGFGGTNAPAPVVVQSAQQSQPAPSAAPLQVNLGSVTPGSIGIKVGDPLDHIKGSYIYQYTDLAVGAKPFPYGLNFERTYDSGAGGTLGPLGMGWTHNYAITAKVGSDGFGGMGQSSALGAVSAIVALYISSDLLNGQTSEANVPLTNYVAETIVNHWFTDQLTNNVVNVSQGWNTEQFTLMADGSYAPPLGTVTILDNNSGYRYRAKSGITLQFNSSGQISSWSNAAGATVTFSYAGGTLSTISNAATNRTLTLSYTNNLISQVQDSASRTVKYAYTNNNLVSVTDARSNNTNFSYDTTGTQDTAGHLTSLYYPLNPTVAYVTNYYDSLGRVYKQKDALGNITLSFFAGSRTETDDPTGTRTVWYNDPQGNILQTIHDYGVASKLNQTVVNTYDAQNNLLSSTNPEGNVTSYTYDSLFNPLTVTTTPKAGSGLPARVQSFTYTVPVSSLPNFEEPASTVDPLGNATQFKYSSSTGTLLTITRPMAGNINVNQSFTYSSIGLPSTSTDAVGIVTSYTYDGTYADQLTQVKVDSGGLNLTSQYGYDSYGDVSSVADSSGNTTTNKYDAQRHLIEVDAPVSGVVTKTTYNANGDVWTVARQVSAAGSGTWETITNTYTYSDKLASIIDPLSNKTSFTYDAADRVTTVSMPVSSTQSRQRSFSYDALGRMAQVIDSTGSTPATLEAHTYTADRKSVV